jgi:hypothetical protein
MNARGYLAGLKWRQAYRLPFELLRARGLLFQIFVFLSFWLPSAAQGTPSVARVDGSIFDSLGAPITGSKDIQIKVYDAASGGSLLWTSDVYTAVASTGHFTINMNAASGSSPSLVAQIGQLTASQGIYFQIEVDSGTANGSMDTATIVLPRIRAKGTIFALSAAATDAITGVTTTATEFNRLAGVTSGVQSQINTINATVAGLPLATGRIDRTGDTMTGKLGLNYTGASVNTALIMNGSREIVSSGTTDTELGYLSGVTSGVSAKLNKFTATEAGYLSGVTNSIQAQINTLSTNGGGYVARAGDTMTGGLGLNYAGVSVSTVPYLDAARKLVSSSVTPTELGYLSGATSTIQTQLNAKATAANHILKAGDTMTGDLGLAGSQATASRALILDSSRRVSSSSVTDTELEYLSGVTQSIQTQLNAKATAANHVLKTGDTMSGNLQLPTMTLTGALTVNGQINSPLLPGTQNVGLTAVTGASNSMVINLVGENGSAPSATNPVGLKFRSSSVTSGTQDTVWVTSATSITIPSGTTIGTSANEQQYISVYALNNSGTVELAVSLDGFKPENILIGTTAVSGGTSPTTLYSATARSNVPIRYLGKLKAPQSTAGVWAANPTEVSVTNRPAYPITDWINAGPITITGATTNPTKGTVTGDAVYWRRVGSDMELKYIYNQTSAGTKGSGLYLFQLPGGYTQNSGGVIGYGETWDGSTIGPSVVMYGNATQFYVNSQGASTYSNVGSTAFEMNNTNLHYFYQVKVQIAGWTVGN